MAYPHPEEVRAMGDRVEQLRADALALGLTLWEPRPGVFVDEDGAGGITPGRREHTLEQAEVLVVEVKLQLGASGVPTPDDPPPI
jgi:hypothetical protein